ncbi:cyclin-L1-like isoform X2 [Polyodon spathula]|uniref:cyclin-L1-like isoform X2 n=1 Tax=Polyodon spathula TaxID=7913 RepID=UPI001B7E9F92|nr:cyclin-L1-like isoform X2 [Polyodon spathula]
MASDAHPGVTNSSAGNEGILIGDRVYSEVFLAIDNSLIPEERLSTTPSMSDGLDLHNETDLRILGCELIQSAGILLRLPQVAMATGQVLFHRFFYSKSFVKHSFEIVAMACVNLASKIEEAPRRVRDVINVFHHLRLLRGKRTPTPLILDQNYINTKNQVIKAERRVLKELGFCVHVKHPHKIIVMYLQVLECEKNQTLVQTAWVVHDGKSHRKNSELCSFNHMTSGMSQLAALLSSQSSASSHPRFTEVVLIHLATSSCFLGCQRICIFASR